MKTNKSYKKRLKVTRSGKIMARKPGLCHFKAKESRSAQLDKKKDNLMEMTNKSKARFLSNI